MIHLLTLAITTLAPQGAEIPPDEFRALHRELVPAEREPWQEIRWRTDLLAARAEAAERGVLLFVWSMNGHPLGCT